MPSCLKYNIARIKLTMNADMAYDGFGNVYGLSIIRIYLRLKEIPQNQIARSRLLFHINSKWNDITYIIVGFTYIRT